MARRKDHSREELAQMILDAAAALVRKGGAQALTARAIGSAIGYAPGTIYNAVGSMEDVAMRLNARTLGALYARVTAAPDAGDGLAARLYGLAMEYRAWARENPDLWLFLFAYRLTGATPEWYGAEVDRLFGVLDRVLAPYVADEAARRVMARTVWASVHGICFLELTGKAGADEGEAPQMMAFLMERLCAGY